MVNWHSLFPGLFPEKNELIPGIYHYRQELDHKQMRLHLRVEENGEGLLTVNASGVIHMNESATLLAKLILDGTPMDKALHQVRGLYRVSESLLQRDYEKMREMIGTLRDSEDACPVFRLNAERLPLFEKAPSAPYRVDLALTYQCNNECHHCYNQTRQNRNALSLSQWEDVLEKLWAAGVPHVCFTGGEATLYNDLTHLIKKAEDIGLVTGLLTNGRKLANSAYVHELVDAGLDHVQITIESHSAKVHDNMVSASGAHAETVAGIRNAVAEDLYLVTNTTLTEKNAFEITETLAFIASLGVRNVAFNCLINTGKAPHSGIELAADTLADVLLEIRDTCDELGLRMIWYSPTRYCDLDPTELEMGAKRCTAASYSMCIEPDGMVLPCQSYYEPVGNILESSWKALWYSERFEAIRQRRDVSDECTACDRFEICGGGCPLADGKRFLCSNSSGEV
jgi:radical SAM protein with 4Fe4S-binding SPASM domain